MKRVARLWMSGVFYSLMAFVVYLILKDLFGAGESVYTDWEMTRKTLGIMVIGSGFSLPVLIYDIRGLAFRWKVMIHMGIAYAVMFSTIVVTGWIPYDADPKIYVVVGFAGAIVGVLIWFAIVNYYQGMADKMNQKLKERDPEYRQLLIRSVQEEESKVAGKYKDWSPETAKSDSFLYGTARRKLDTVWKGWKEPEWSKISTRIGVILLILFALFFIVMGSLPDSFYEIP